MRVTIYTDGACLETPGPAATAWCCCSADIARNSPAGFRLTTTIEWNCWLCGGLRSLKQRCLATVYSDSQYVVNALKRAGRLAGRANGWKRKKEKAINADLWQHLLELGEKHDVKMVWVRGHSGVQKNERCDQLSVAAANEANLPIDEEYERREPLSARA